MSAGSWRLPAALTGKQGGQAGAAGKLAPPWAEYRPPRCRHRSNTHLSNGCVGILLRVGHSGQRQAAHQQQRHRELASHGVVARRVAGAWWCALGSVDVSVVSVCGRRGRLRRDVWGRRPCSSQFMVGAVHNFVGFAGSGLVAGWLPFVLRMGVVAAEARAMQLCVVFGGRRCGWAAAGGPDDGCAGGRCSVAVGATQQGRPACVDACAPSCKTLLECLDFVTMQLRRTEQPMAAAAVHGPRLSPLLQCGESQRNTHTSWQHTGQSA